MLDGEAAELLPSDLTSFQALQHPADQASGPLVYFVFDLLYLNGENIAALPLKERLNRLLVSSEAATQLC